MSLFAKTGYRSFFEVRGRELHRLREFLSSPDFGEISGKFESQKFREIQGNSVEFSGFCIALNMNSVGIPGEFRGNAGFSGVILKELWGHFSGEGPKWHRGLDGPIRFRVPELNPFFANRVLGG